MFGAKRIVVSSASSKTAYGTAFFLKDNCDVKLVTLTSRGNRDFVTGLGTYHDMVKYEELDAMDGSEPTLYDCFLLG